MNSQKDIEFNNLGKLYENFNEQYNNEDNVNDFQNSILDKMYMITEIYQEDDDSSSIPETYLKLIKMSKLNNYDKSIEKYFLENKYLQKSEIKNINFDNEIQEYKIKKQNISISKSFTCLQKKCFLLQNIERQLDSDSICDQLIKQHPKKAISQTWKGRTCLLCQKQIEALGFINDSIVIDPQNQENQQQLAEINYSLKNQEKSLYYQRYLAFNVNYYYDKILYNIGSIQRESKNQKLAIFQLKKNYSRYKTDIESIIELTAALCENESYEQAYQQILQGLSLDKDNISLLNQQALQFFKQGKHEVSKKTLDSVLLREPTNSTAICTYGLIYNSLGLNDEAIELQNKGNMFEECIEFQCNIAEAQFDKELQDKSLDQWNKAIEQNKLEAYAFHGKGLTLKALGKKYESFLAFLRAILLDDKYVFKCTLNIVLMRN